MKAPKTEQAALGPAAFIEAARGSPSTPPQQPAVASDSPSGVLGALKNLFGDST